MPSDAPDFSNLAETVSCRPSAEWWAWIGMAVLFALMGGLGIALPSNPPPPNPAAQTAFFGAVCVACLLGAALAAWWMFQARLKADADGLRWRRFGGWKAARWEEVRDFYDRLPAQSQAGRSFLRAIIQTSRGTISFGSQWTHVEPFRAQVERLATSAAARQWGLLGSRPCDSWPRVFRYDTWQNIWTPRVLLKLALTALGYLLTSPLQQAMRQAGQVGWGVTLAGLGVYVLLIAFLGAFFLMPLAQYRAAGRRKAERITADTHGIVFDDGARRVEAAWVDVTGYGIAPGSGILTVRYVVETQQGDFDFLAVLSDAPLLMAIVRRYAEEAADKEWRPRVNPEALGGEASRWSGGQVGVGARVYHYRTRMHRALLGMPLVFGMICGILSWGAWQGWLPGAQAAGLAGIAAALGGIFFSGWHAYRVCRTETDEDGLTQITPLARQRLLWSQVEDYFLTGDYHSGVVRGHGKQIRFSQGIVGYDELQKEIARRAVVCGGKVWERGAGTHFLVHSVHRGPPKAGG